jgi:nicotinate-nucleotide adenylyltransferase
LRVPQRLGVFGGTFDPPHLGHLGVARAARDNLALDRVLLVVANDPWKKSPERAITPAADRLAMVGALVDGEPGLEVSDVEIRRGGPSYTVTTLREMRVANADAELFLIIGRDLVDDFPSWHESVEIARLASILLVVPPVDVSSTELREQLQAYQQDGSAVSPHIPPAVLSVIRERGLYRRNVDDTVMAPRS